MSKITNDGLTWYWYPHGNSWRQRVYYRLYSLCGWNLSL